MTSPLCPALSAMVYSGASRASRTRRMPTASSPDDAVQRGIVQGGLGAEQGYSAAGYDALLNGGAGGRQGVFGAALALVQFRFGGGADLDDGHAAGQVGQTLLQLLAVIIGGGVLDLNTQLRTRDR